MIRIRSPQDLGAAVIFMLVGLAGLYFGAGLPGMQTGGQLGSGTMPRILSAICLAFAALMLLRALRLDGPAIAPVPWRALMAVSVAVVVFGALIEWAGFVATAILTPLVAAAAIADQRWGEALVVAVALGFGSALLFVVLLGQPLPLWWGAR
jgi:hypothetical protein